MSPTRRIAFATTALVALAPLAARAQQVFQPGNLVISRSIYQTPGNTITVGQALPGGGIATSDASFPSVFNNETPDPSFGITSPIILDQVTTSGALVNTQTLTGIVTSFPSKSEEALNLSADGSKLNFIDYAAPLNALDVSNSNTPNYVDSTNPVQLTYQREVGTLSATGALSLQAVDAYSGNNGRAAITGANGVTYLAGNAGNGTKNATAATLTDQGLNGGIQIVVPGQAETTSAGRFSPNPAIAGDKPSKDTNFRGLTIFNNTLYTTKGSGGNGINTVYQVGIAGTLPGPGTGNTISVLPGFTTTPASGTAGTVQYFPFGLFFADANTLYVADEGNGTITNTNAGIEKWSLVGGVWVQDYTLQANLFGTYTLNGTTFETTGLRNLTGTVNGDGTVSLYAVTATGGAKGVFGYNDQGADANEVVAINDLLASTTLPTTPEPYTTIEAPTFENVYRGISEAPSPVPEPASLTCHPTILNLPVRGGCSLGNLNPPTKKLLSTRFAME